MPCINGWQIWKSVQKTCSFLSMSLWIMTLSTYMCSYKYFLHVNQLKKCAKSLVNLFFFLLSMVRPFIRYFISVTCSYVLGIRFEEVKFTNYRYQFTTTILFLTCKWNMQIKVCGFFHFCLKNKDRNSYFLVWRMRRGILSFLFKGCS